MKVTMKGYILKERLLKSRDICPGLNNSVYLVTDYLAQSIFNTKEDVAPHNLIVGLTKMFANFTGISDRNSVIPDYLTKNKKDICDHIDLITKIIDSFDNIAFSTEFRMTYNTIYKC